MTFKETEYSRRNSQQAMAIGAVSNTKSAIKRLNEMKNPPLWMSRALTSILERAQGLPQEMARWRDTAPDRPHYVEGTDIVETPAEVAAELAKLRALVKELQPDADRYRHIRHWTRGITDGRGHQSFDYKLPDPLDNLMQGSVAQHLDKSMDFAIEISKKWGFPR